MMSFIGKGNLGTVRKGLSKLALVLATVGVMSSAWAVTTTSTSATKAPSHHSSTHHSSHHTSHNSKATVRRASHNKTKTSHKSVKVSKTKKRKVTHQHKTHHVSKNSTNTHVHTAAVATPTGNSNNAPLANPGINAAENNVNNNNPAGIGDNTSVDPTSAEAANATPPTTTSGNTGQRLTSYVHKFVSSLHYTTYKSGGAVFDNNRGVYETDCSHYVDHILQVVCPQAYSSLVSSTGTKSPDTANYYSFFAHLPNNSNYNYNWGKVENAQELQAGDILVFRYKSRTGADRGGHVMVVMGTPIRENNALLVRVTDSAAAGHSDDTRHAHSSGIGIGTLVLKIDSATGKPSAYAWEVDSPWQSRVNIAMARPLETSV